jgi:RHS repeat-associated protein
MLTAVLIVASSAVAQIANVTNITSTPTPGTGHDYIHMLNETVNPANGSVSVRIQVPVPPARKLTIPFAFAYDSNGVHHFVPAGPGFTWLSNKGFLSQGGWTYTMPMMSADTSQIVYSPDLGENVYTCDFTTDFMFQDPTGGRHALALSHILDSSGQCQYVQPQPQEYLFGGDDYLSAGLALNNTGLPPLTVTDTNGTVYLFPTQNQSEGGGNPNTTTFYGLPSQIEDRNGNKVTITDNLHGAFTASDTVGRISISSSGFGATGNTITIPGLTSPYVLTWGTANTHYTPSYHIVGSSCTGPSTDSETQAVVTAITLPNGKQYQFFYDATYGLLNKVVYPTGGYVSYTWGLNPLSDGGNFALSQSYGTYPCYFTYDTYAVTHRYVSFDGSTVAFQQDFNYSTNFPSGSTAWTSKQTTVTNRDLVRGTNWQTVYNYSPAGALNPPNAQSIDSTEIPLEQTVTYKDTNGSTLRTVTKAWFDQYLLGCELTTLDSGQISATWNSYFGPLLADKKEYDYGLVTSATTCQSNSNTVPPPSGITPTRETVINYQTFSNFPIVIDTPSQVITYGSGTRAAETDWSYDQTSVASVSNLPPNTHDETNYGPSSTTPRGNPTTATRKCLQSCTDSVTKYAYDETGQVLSMTDACGNATCADVSGSNHTTMYSYADSYTVLSGGLNVSYSPTASTDAYLTKITNPLGQTHQFTYDFNNGQLTASTDANSQITKYLYNDIFARPTLVNNPDGGQTTIAYNDTPYNPATPSPSVTTTRAMTSTTNVTSLAAFDGLGHPVRSVLSSDPDCASGDRTDTTYTGLGQVYTVSNPYCSTGDSTYGLTTYAYDGLGRTIQVTHPDNSTVLTTYTGRATQVQDEGNGNGTQRVTRISQTDGLGRLKYLCEVAPGPFVGAGGSSSSSLIGSSGTPADCSQNTPGGLDLTGNGFLTSYLYDILANLTQVNQAGVATRTFSYDSLSRLLTASNPESGSISYAYDANGNLSTKTSPLPNQSGSATVTTSYQYDALNRLTQKSYNDGSTPTTTYAFDASCHGTTYQNMIGRIEYAAVPGWYFCYGYDVMGRPLRKDLSMSVPSGTLYHAYAYDLLGDTTAETAGYGTAYYAYNTAGRPITVTSSYSDTNNPATLFSSAHYNAFGGLNSDTLGNNETETYTYVPHLTRLQSYTAMLNSTTIYNFNINSFAPNGDVLAATDTANGNWTYSYDQFNRLVGSNKNSGQAVYTYVYDRFGNRWQQNGPQAFLATFTGNNPGNPQNNNRMDGYSYDAAGNLLNDGNHSYTYDAENRILKVDNGTTATYAYDPDGNRVQKTQATGSGGDPAGTWQFLYDQSGRMIQRFNGTLWQGNIFVGGRHLVEDGGGTNFSHADWLGTERVRVYYQTGAVCESIASLPFGDGQTTTGACYHSSPLHFTGKPRDSESGLDYFGARFDASSFGRFMSPDPLMIMRQKFTDPQQWNAYSYARNNPLRFFDPTGKYVCTDEKKCAQFEKARQEALKSKNAGDVRAAKAYGGLGEKNGVYVSFADTLKGDRGGSVTRHEQGIEADPNRPNLFRATVDVTIKSSNASNQETLVHEGSHVADRQDFVNAIPADGNMENAKALNITLRQSEIRAYELSIGYALRGNKPQDFGPCGLMQECKFTPGMMPAMRDQLINDLLNSQYKDLDKVLFPEWPHQ